MRSRTSSRVVVAACGLALVLGACGSGSSGSAGQAGSSSPGAVAAAESVAASVSANPDGGSGSGDAPYSDAEACAWLKKNLPDVKSATNAINAQLALTLGLSSFFQEHGGLEKADGSAYDAATVRGCKTEHDVAVKKAGISSFGNL